MQNTNVVLVICAPSNIFGLNLVIMQRDNFIWLALFQDLKKEVLTNCTIFNVLIIFKLLIRIDLFQLVRIIWWFTNWNYDNYRGTKYRSWNSIEYEMQYETHFSVAYLYLRSFVTQYNYVLLCAKYAGKYFHWKCSFNMNNLASSTF